MNQAISIKRDYEILPDNRIVLGIRITNNTNLVISDVQVIPDYNKSLFRLQEDEVLMLENIPPTITRTVNITLKPLGYVPGEKIDASISYRDPKWDKHMANMQPIEVHCICPFLHANPMDKNRFMQLSDTSYTADAGMNFEGIGVQQITSFLMQICTTRFYTADVYTFAEGNMLSFSAETSDGDTYYLLSALIKENQGLTQVMLRAVSGKSYGLQGFLDEIVSDIRRSANTVGSAREVGILKSEQVKTIIDSVIRQSNPLAGSTEHSVIAKDGTVRQNNVLPDRNIKAETMPTGMINQLPKDADVEKMYDAYLEDIRSIQGEMEDKRDEIPLIHPRNSTSDRKLNTIRSTAPIPKTKEKRLRGAKGQKNHNEKKKYTKKQLIVMFFTVYIVFVGIALTAIYLRDSGGFQISGNDENTTETIVIDFLNAVNEGDYNTAHNMYEGNELLVPASINMIFTNGGIKAGSIKQIDIVSTELSGDIAVIQADCTAASVDFMGNEADTSVIPVYFRLEKLENGWMITNISFGEPFEIEYASMPEIVLEEESSEELLNEYELLQQKAESTGKQATQEVSSNLMVKTIEGVRAKNTASDLSDTIDLLKLKIGLNVGSSSVDMNQVVISISDGTTSNNLIYAGNQRAYASTGSSDGSMNSFSSSPASNLASLLTRTTTIGNNELTNSQKYYTLEVIRDEDNSFSQKNPVMNTGDLITIYIATTSRSSAFEGFTLVGNRDVSSGLKYSGLNVVPRTTVNIVLTPESGAATTADFVTPSSYGVTETVQMYP